MSKDVVISVIQPKGFVHAKCFDPVVAVLHQSLSFLNHKVTVVTNQLASSGVNIVIGAHLLDSPSDALKNPNAIIYNFEQFCKDSRSIRESYIKALAERPYWEYSKANFGTEGLHSLHVPFSYSPVLDYGFVYKKSYSTKKYSFDVLFYGSMNDRRQHILNELSSNGLNVKAVYGMYDDDLSALVNSSKLVLNMHFYDNKIFEAVRVIPLLARAVPVVTESSVDDGDYSFLNGGMACVDYKDLAKTCKALVDNEPMRLEMALVGRDKVRTVDMKSVLKKVGF